MTRATRSEICQRAMDLAGGPSVIAGALGMTTIGIHAWKRVPRERIARMSELSGIPEAELMQDWINHHVAKITKQKGSNQ